MRSIITLICGIMVIASMFMKWYSLEYYGFEFDSESGWKAMSGSDVPWVGAGGPSLTFVGAILVVAISAISFVLPRIHPEAKALSTYIDIVGRLCAGLALVGGIWYAFDVDTVPQYYGPIPANIAEGVWLAMSASFIAAVVGVSIPGFVAPSPIVSNGFRAPESREKGMVIGRRIKRDLVERKLEGKDNPAGMAVDPGMAKDHFNKASDYEARGQDDQAIIAYSDAIYADPNYALAYFYRGSLFALNNRAEQAREDFEKVIEISGDPDLSAMAQKRIDNLDEPD